MNLESEIRELQYGKADKGAVFGLPLVFIALVIWIFFGSFYTFPFQARDGYRQYLCWNEDIAWPWEDQPATIANCVAVDHVKRTRPRR